VDLDHAAEDVRDGSLAAEVDVLDRDVAHAGDVNSESSIAGVPRGALACQIARGEDTDTVRGRIEEHLARGAEGGAAASARARIVDRPVLPPADAVAVHLRLVGGIVTFCGRCWGERGHCSR